MAGPMDDKAAKLALYESLLKKWGARINLVGPEAKRNLGEHIGEAVEAAGFLRLEGEALDFGSGGGLPAIPLAILGEPHVRFHLVEADQKKWAFLKAAVRECGLNCTVWGDRLQRALEKMEPSVGFDLVTSRAVGYPEEWLPQVLPRLRPGASVALFQSSSNPPLVEGLQHSSSHRLSRGENNFLMIMKTFHVEHNA